MFVELTDRGMLINGELSEASFTTVSYDIGKQADLKKVPVVPDDGYVVWEFRYESDPNLLFDDGYLAILEHGLRTFSEVVYTQYADRTLYCVLGELEASFPDSVNAHFSDTSFLEAMRSQSDLFFYRLAGYEAIAAKLQFLATELPLELQSAVRIYGDLSISEQAYFLSKNVFEHIFPLYRMPNVSRSGILLPDIDTVDLSLLCLLDQVEDTYRLLPENRAVEMWEELDELVFFEKYKGPLGERALQGFEAAGGESIKFEALRALRT